MIHVEQISDITPIPQGGRLLHIGPAKTGTTTLQGALHTCREQMAEHGVEYAGRQRHSRRAMVGIAYAKPPEGYPADVLKRWKQLAASVRRSTADRVVLSSELLARIPPARARMLVDDVGGNVHLVLTMRPLAAILASRWQQSVQDEFRVDYPGWLEQVFGHRSGTREKPDFWLRYDLEHHIERWAPIVGEENITFLVLDPHNRDMLLHSFERMLALPAGLLVPDATLTNPSLPHAEIEMLLAFNRVFTREGHTREEYVHGIRGRAVRQFKADPETLKQGRIQTPRWAALAANEAAAPWIEAIEKSQTRVIGQLDHLLVDPEAFPEGSATPTSVSTDSAGELAFRLYNAGLEYGERRARKVVEQELAAREVAAQALADEAALTSGPRAAVRHFVGQIGTRLRSLRR